MTNRYQISEPFNFQHLAHTGISQFHAMLQAEQNGSVPEPSALQTAGPTVDRPVSPDNQSILPGPDEPMSTGPGQFPHVDDHDEPASPISPASHNVPRIQRPLASPVYESGDESQADSGPVLGRCSPSYRPTYSNDSGGVAPHGQDCLTNIDAASSQAGGPMDYPITTWNNDIYNFVVPHAVTTPDEATYALQPPPFQIVRTELSRVLEEDELLDVRRSSLAASVSQSSTASMSHRHTRSFPSPHQPTQRSSQAGITSGSPISRSPMKRPPSVLEQPIMDIPFRPQSSEYRAHKVSGGCDSWEEDIDWCYENQAEADSNFDWTRSSAFRFEPSQDLGDGPEEENDGDDGASRVIRTDCRTSSIYSSPPPHIVPFQEFVPGMDPPSAVSTQSSLDCISEAVTPTQPYPEQHFLTAACKPTCRDSGDHVCTLPPSDAESFPVYEDYYHVIYARKSLAETGFNFGLSERSSISSISPRSSHSPISKSSSQESFLPRLNRRSNSGGSVPDLVFSRNARDRPDSSVVAVDNDGLSASETPAASTSTHRRGPSLAKEVAQKTIMSKIADRDSFNPENDQPSIFNASIHERPRSEIPSSNIDKWCMPVPPRPTATRARSGSTSALRRTGLHRKHSPHPIALSRRKLKS